MSLTEPPPACAATAAAAPPPTLLPLLLGGGRRRSTRSGCFTSGVEPAATDDHLPAIDAGSKASSSSIAESQEL